MKPNNPFKNIEPENKLPEDLKKNILEQIEEIIAENNEDKPS